MWHNYLESNGSIVSSSQIFKFSKVIDHIIQDIGTMIILYETTESAFCYFFMNELCRCNRNWPCSVLYARDLLMNQSILQSSRGSNNLQSKWFWISSSSLIDYATRAHCSTTKFLHRVRSKAAAFHDIVAAAASSTTRRHVDFGRSLRRVNELRKKWKFFLCIWFPFIQLFYDIWKINLW